MEKKFHWIFAIISVINELSWTSTNVQSSLNVIRFMFDDDWTKFVPAELKKKKLSAGIHG